MAFRPTMPSLAVGKHTKFQQVAGILFELRSPYFFSQSYRTTSKWVTSS